MKLIIGLGNPGEKHKNNRHNVGHMVIDAMEKLTKGVVVKKTNIFMNDSGEEVKRLMLNAKCPIANLYIVHDDLDIPLGKYKIQFGKGPKVHNGVNDIEQILGTPEFWRIRVGVDNRDPENRISGEKYTLEDFTSEERKIIKNLIPEIIKDLISRIT